MLICWKMCSIGAQLISTEKLKGLRTNLYHLGNEEYRNKRLLGSLTTLLCNHRQSNHIILTQSALDTSFHFVHEPLVICLQIWFSRHICTLSSLWGVFTFTEQLYSWPVYIHLLLSQFCPLSFKSSFLASIYPFLSAQK